MKETPETPKGYVCLGRGGTFKVPSCKYFFGLYYDTLLDTPTHEWYKYPEKQSGVYSYNIYYAPEDSEIAKLNNKNMKTTIEEYLAEQKEWIEKNNVKVGDKVTISKPDILNDEWSDCVSWTEEMDKYIGKNGIILDIGEKGILIENDINSYRFPYNALTKVPEEIDGLEIGGTAYYLNEKVNVLGLQKKTAWIQRVKKPVLLSEYDLGEIVSRKLLTLKKREIKVGETVKLTSEVAFGNHQKGNVLYIHETHALVLWEGKKVPEMRQLSNLVVA